MKRHIVKLLLKLGVSFHENLACGKKVAGSSADSSRKFVENMQRDMLPTLLDVGDRGPRHTDAFGNIVL